MEKSAAASLEAPVAPQGALAGAIRVLALIEEEFVSGVARNLLSLGRALGEASVMRGTRAVSLRIATFDRRAAGCRAGAGTPFICAARDAGLQVDVIRERFRYDLRAARLLAAHARRCAPDVIETHSVKSHFLVALAGAARGRRGSPSITGTPRPTCACAFTISSIAGACAGPTAS